MTYTCKQTIVDMLNASGPQSMGALRRECRAQSTDYNVASFLRAIVELQHNGFMTRADDVDGIVYEIV